MSVRGADVAAAFADALRGMTPEQRAEMDRPLAPGEHTRETIAGHQAMLAAKAAREAGTHWSPYEKVVIRFHPGAGGGFLEEYLGRERWNVFGTYGGRANGADSVMLFVPVEGLDARLAQIRADDRVCSAVVTGGNV